MKSKSQTSETPGSALDQTPLSVLHLLPGSTFGGAEFAVLRLATAERARGMNSRVLALKEAGPLEPRFRAAGVPLLSLGVRPSLGGLVRVGRWCLQKEVPAVDVLVGWLPWGNMFASLAARRGIGLVWNVLQADLSADLNSLSTRALIRMEARLSFRRPHRVVCNSEAARTAHLQVGFDPKRMEVIPNGVDTDVFKPVGGARAERTQTLGISESSFVVGHLARWDPHKDHHTFIRAADRLLRDGVDAHFLLAGPGVDSTNKDVSSWIRETAAPERFHLLGLVPDAPAFLSSLDVFCLSSVAESSSYVLLEAMACGIPCVSTDAGDARRVLADVGSLVPLQDPVALSQTLRVWAEKSPADRAGAGAAARRRVEQDYSFAAMFARYESVYRAAASGALLHH